MDTSKIEGFVLVGGASSRMGRAKGDLPFDGTTLGGRAAETLGGIGIKVLAVGGEIAGLPYLPDLDRPASENGMKAAVFGLRTVFHNSNAEWAAVLACDLPLVTGDFFLRLISTAAEHPEVDAVVPRQPDGRPQPLAAIYRCGPALSAVEDSIQNGEMRLTEFLARLTIRYLDPEAYADHDPAGRLFTNVNTPEDYRAALEVQGRSL